MITIVSTVGAYSLAAYLGAAEMVSATSAMAFRASAAPRDIVQRSVAESPRAYSEYVPELLAEDVTAVSELMPIVLAPDGPEHGLIAELSSFRSLKDGWDGEGAAAPDRTAIRDAVRFIRAAGLLAGCLEPTLHTDGSVLLELEGGLDGALKFRGDSQIVYAIKGVQPGTVLFDGSNVPDALKLALDPSPGAVRRAA